MSSTRELAYEQLAHYPPPAALPSLLSKAEYRARLLTATPLNALSAKALFSASGVSRLIQNCAANPEYFDQLLRQTDIRFAPFSLLSLNATLLLKRDPNVQDPLRRAASLILAACDFQRALSAGTLTPDSYRGQPLEMRQYANLFGTCLHPHGTASRVSKSDCRDTIMIASRGHFFPVRIVEHDGPVGFEELHARLAAVVRRAQSLPSQGRAGLLAAGNFVERWRAFHGAATAENRASFERLASALFVVCLDLDSSPETLEDTAAAMQREGVNRWHLSSFQLVINARADAAVVASFPCGLDGNVMGRFASELWRRSQGIAHYPAETGSQCAIEPLGFELPETVIARGAARVRSTTSPEHGVGEILQLGQQRFARTGLSADALFNLALMVTVKRLIGELPRVFEHTSVSRYRNMGVEMAGITSQQARDFVNYCAEPSYDRTRAAELLRRAVIAHRERLDDARRQISLKWLSMLNVRHSSMLRRVPAWLLAMSVAGRPDVIVSQPKPRDEISCVGRPGIRIPYVRLFGLHYQLHSEKISLVLMPSPTWQLPARVLFAALETSLHQLLELIETPSTRREPVASVAMNQPTSPRVPTDTMSAE